MVAREGFGEEMKDKVKILESWRLEEEVFQVAHKKKDVSSQVNCLCKAQRFEWACVEKYSRLVRPEHKV